MAQHDLPDPHDGRESEWLAFPGGELEGKRPRALCPACRDALRSAARTARRSDSRRSPDARSHRTLCFQCYRTGLERDRAIRAAGSLAAASHEHFQGQLPFEAVNRPRLAMLKAERANARATVPAPVNARRHAQIEARHALQRVAAGLDARGLQAADREPIVFQAVHAAELQLPESWLPFVVSR